MSSAICTAFDCDDRIKFSATHESASGDYSSVLHLLEFLEFAYQIDENFDNKTKGVKLALVTQGKDYQMPAPKESLDDIPRRLQIDIPASKLAKIDELVVECGLSTRKELFNWAMSMLSWAIDETKNGNSIASIDRSRKNFEVLRMPILDSARIGKESIESDDGAAAGHSAGRSRQAAVVSLKR